MADLPVVVTAAGAQPTPPAVMRASLVAAVAATNPGYTANLPGSLIEDIASTDVIALLICDTARVETINSLTPYGANDFLLLELGQVYIGPGAAPAVPTNTSVYVLFSGTVGYAIDVGFTISDGTYQYVVQDGGIIGSDGFSELIFCTSPTAGSWAVPTNTVDQLVTSVPAGVTLSCTNPEAGVSGAAAESAEQYRARVIAAGQAICQGTPNVLKTALGRVTGVQQRLISVRQNDDGTWTVICGGGDPYQIADAIFKSGMNIATLAGSVLEISAITRANPGVITTVTNHGYSNGQVASASGIVGMTPLNGVDFTVTVVTEKSFSVGINTSGYPVYVSGGVLTPNLRNISPDIYDPPDIYSVPFVNPPAQTVTMAVIWNTTAPNFVSQAAVSQKAAPALAAYVNSVLADAPLNVIEMRAAFVAAVSTVLAASQVSTLIFTVSINGIVTAPDTGTDLIYGDPESYFTADSSGIVVSRG